MIPLCGLSHIRFFLKLALDGEFISVKRGGIKKRWSASFEMM